MNHDENLAAILAANILTKRRILGALRKELAGSEPAHPLVAGWSDTKLTAFLKVSEVPGILEDLQPHEVARLVELIAEKPAASVPPRPEKPAATPPPLPPQAQAKPVLETVEEQEEETPHWDPEQEEEEQEPPLVVVPDPTPLAKPTPAPVKPAAPAKPTPAPVAAPVPGDAEGRLRELIRELAAGAAPSPTGGAVDAEAVRALIQEELPGMLKEAAKNMPPFISWALVETPRGSITIESRQHFRFPLLMVSMQAEAPVLMTGPAGTGKTTAALNSAKALGIPSYLQAFSPLTTSAALVGFVDAAGTYQETGFVKSFRDGGVFIADEFDAARPDVAIILNSAIANRVLMLPTGEVLAASENWQFVGCANTYGTGPDALYTGRNRLDAATLDRFFTLEFPHDPGLEAAHAGVSMDSPPCDLAAGGIPTPAEWLKTVQAARDALESVQAQAVISQRATILGIQLAACGVGRDWLFAGLLAKGLKGTALDALRKLQ